ncbi:hypothetical protein Pcinc_004606 [Petrolisthes cinctipes]|uniref:PiggyBac transposable element-derived protein domain-containing protein n=1 Tax=Petrolisthes cinctipes TaxID=88211 RepID=A0AAE1KZY6_PETCI|nr:hypothetical protein Pcinc_004606 [Petrolisthes cinctipes]
MYIPSKPAKYGIKLVLINDCKTRYLLGCKPYIGKEQTRLTAGVGLGHYYTKELTRPYHHTNRNVTTDNWFTFVPLVTDLLQSCGMTLVGTLKANKQELPQKMKSKEDREPGTTAFLFTNEMTLVSYVPPKTKNKKLVLLLSTMHSQPTLGEKGKPEVIEFYNSTKGGVDAFDGMCALYSCNRKTKRRPPLCLLLDSECRCYQRKDSLHSKPREDRRCQSSQTPSFHATPCKSIHTPMGSEEVIVCHTPKAPENID